MSALAPAAVPDASTTVPSVTTTTVPATTTTSPALPQPADRMQTQGYLDPPLQPSNGYGFTGTGAMQISVLWSGSTYLTMTVSCPSGNQSVGGTSAMAASLSGASGSCRADRDRALVGVRGADLHDLDRSSRWIAGTTGRGDTRF